MTLAGELCTRGYSVMPDYWDNPEDTQAIIDETRWLHSGDLAVMDENGYVSIVGRIKDLIIRGGENISPKEIEDFLIVHEGISDVQVIGVYSEKYGEKVMAWIFFVPNAKILFILFLFSGIQTAWERNRLQLFLHFYVQQTSNYFRKQDL